MDSNSQNMSKKSENSTEKLHKKIKETYTKLSDDDIKLYDRKRDQFFSKLQEKYNVSKEYVRKTLEKIEKDCGYNRTL